MTTLSTTWLGLKLRNPLVVSSSSLTDSVEKIVHLQEAGAGAVVLKSIFEEQLRLDSEKMDKSFNLASDVSAEGTAYFTDIPLEVGPGPYLKLVSDAKKAATIPIVGSINCNPGRKWGAFAKQIEQAGADALELNIYAVETDARKTSEQIEQQMLDVVADARANVKIPLSVKLSPFLTSIPHMVAEVAKRGANSVSLFNRFYQPNFDIDELKISSHLQLSRPDDALLPLRWIALLYGRNPGLQLAATSGIHDGRTALKVILAGASVAMVCSAIFKNKERHLGLMLREMEDWLNEKEYRAVDDIRGILSQKTCPDPQAFERAQYIKMLVGHD